MSLEDDVRYLMDRQAIMDLLIKYNRLVDAQDYDRLVVEVYAENGSDHHGNYKAEGRDAIRDFFVEGTSNLAVTGHVISNDIIEIDGDTARAQTTCSSAAWTKATAAKGALEPADYVLWVGYDDDLIRTPDGWRILNRRVINNGFSLVSAGVVPPSQSHITGPAERRDSNSR